jgi:hypothetical protein
VYSYGSFGSREEAATAVLGEAKWIVDALDPLTHCPRQKPSTDNATANHWSETARISRVLLCPGESTPLMPLVYRDVPKSIRKVVARDRL